MQSPKIYAIYALLIVMAGIGADRLVGRIEFPQPVLLPIQTFPRTIGEWTAGADVPEGSEVQQKLPTARTVDRPYTDPSGQTVQLFLLTATAVADFHNPTGCFPAHGWQLNNQKQLQLNGVTINTMSASQSGEHDLVWYWRTGTYKPFIPNSLLQRLYDFRMNTVRDRERTSLFVRLMAPDTERGRQCLADFARSIQKPVADLTDIGERLALNQSPSDTGRLQ